MAVARQIKEIVDTLPTCAGKSAHGQQAGATQKGHNMLQAIAVERFIVWVSR